MSEHPQTHTAGIYAAQVEQNSRTGLNANYRGARARLGLFCASVSNVYYTARSSSLAVFAAALMWVCVCG